MPWAACDFRSCNSPPHPEAPAAGGPRRIGSRAPVATGAKLESLVVRGSLRSRVVLARIGIVRSFHEERPAPGGHPGRVADRRIVRARAFWAGGEQDRDRLFIGP